MPHADGDTVDPPRRWVEAFYDSESEVRGVLEDVREAHLLGEYDTVRERLRAFAEAEEGIFRLVALAVIDAESLCEDLTEQYDDDADAPVDDIRALGDEYDRLATDFELVFTERVNDLRNPMPTLRRGFRYSRSVNLPRLEYDLYSGEVKLCEFVHPPSQSLMLARGIIASTRELLERVAENDDVVADVEQERIAVAADHLDEELESLDAFVPRTADDADDRATGDVYDDWSFY